MECKRLVRKRWPGVTELGSVTSIDQKTVDALCQAVGSGVDFVLCGGGSPCQDLSSLLADGAGLEGTRSRLFFEMPRIFALLKATFHCPVFNFVENVFSISPDNRQRFSEAQQLKPVLLDSKWVSWCRRPRVFWCNWKITQRGQEKLLDHGDYLEWQLPNLQPCAHHWLDKGCAQHEAVLMPTLTRALPRRTPPKAPAGIERASARAIARWREDLHKFQVYHYEESVMVIKPDHSLRLPMPHRARTVDGL